MKPIFFFRVALIILLGVANGFCQDFIQYVETKNLDLLESQTTRLGILESDPSTKDLRVVELDRQLLFNPALNVNLPEKSYLLQRRELVFTEDKGVWSGDSAEDADATFVERGQNITGNIHVGDQLFAIRPVGEGLHAFFEIDTSKFPPDHDPTTDSPASLENETHGDQEPVSENATYEIDVMVIYTPDVSRAYSDVASLIDLAIQETNESYHFSRIRAKLNLVHIEEFDYTETGNFKTDVDRLAAKNEGYLDSIHAVRDEKKADVVVLLSQSGTSCGRAKAIDADESTSFAVCKARCATGYYSFGHEIGHLLGARHNPEADPTDTPFEYGHGFLKASKKWRTIMAYDCPGGGCKRKKFWSSPLTKFDGSPTGTQTKNDNARVLNNRARKVSNFRNSVVE